MSFVSLKLVFSLVLVGASLFYLYVAAMWVWSHVSERLLWNRPKFPRHVSNEVWEEFRSRRWWVGLTRWDWATAALSLHCLVF